jgi:hypothetical protein
VKCLTLLKAWAYVIISSYVSLSTSTPQIKLTAEQACHFRNLLEESHQLDPFNSGQRSSSAQRASRNNSKEWRLPKARYFEATAVISRIFCLCVPLMWQWNPSLTTVDTTRLECFGTRVWATGRTTTSQRLVYKQLKYSTSKANPGTSHSVARKISRLASCIMPRSFILAYSTLFRQGQDHRRPDQ